MDSVQEILWPGLEKAHCHFCPHSIGQNLVTGPNATTKVAGKRSLPVWPGEKAGLVSSQSIFATLSAVTYHLLQPWALY